MNVKRAAFIDVKGGKNAQVTADGDKVILQFEVSLFSGMTTKLTIGIPLKALAEAFKILEIELPHE